MFAALEASSQNLSASEHRCSEIEFVEKAEKEFALMYRLFRSAYFQDTQQPSASPELDVIVKNTP